MKNYIISLVFLLLLYSCNGQNKTPSNPSSSTSILVNELDPSVEAKLVGSWKNQLGSTLKITKINVKTGEISGSYTSPSGTTGEWFPLIGWVNERPAKDTSVHHAISVSFSVRWGQYGSITSWNGVYYIPKKTNVPTIIGDWLLSRSNADFEWGHVNVGQDRFTQ